MPGQTNHYSRNDDGPIIDAEAKNISEEDEKGKE